MLQDMFRVIARNRGLYAVSLFAQMVIFLASNHGAPKSILLGALVVLLVFQFLLIQNLLGDEKSTRSPLSSFIGYFLKSLLFYILAFLIAVVLFAVPQAFRLFPVWANAMLAVISLVIGWVAMMILLGSWIPAGMAGIETSFMAALRRRRQSFFSRLGKALLISILLYLVSSLVPFVIGYTHPSIMQESGSLWMDLSNITALPFQLLIPAVVAVDMVEQFRRASTQGRTAQLVEVF
ncbi:hypothetical protein [Oryzifoliimicrobium ureilyticus]|uniref:hypothetical protein n=1 Tax=Oryzifoliimicrobium ureilyticus TaxID=3113724 RepID=UPI0030767C91